MALWGGSRASVKFFAASRAAVLPASSSVLGSWSVDPRAATRDLMCDTSRVAEPMFSIKYRLFLKLKKMKWNAEEKERVSTGTKRKEKGTPHRR